MAQQVNSAPSDASPNCWRCCISGHCVGKRSRLEDDGHADFLFGTPIRLVTPSAEAVHKQATVSWDGLPYILKGLIPSIIYVPSLSALSIGHLGYCQNMSAITHWLSRTQDHIPHFTSTHSTPAEDFEIVCHPKNQDELGSDFGVQSFHEDEDAAQVAASASPSLRSATLSDSVSELCLDCCSTGHESSEETSYSICTSPKLRIRKPCILCSTAREPDNRRCKSCIQDLRACWELSDCLNFGARQHLMPLDEKQRSDYSHAGRLPENTFKDFRSASKAKKRWQANQEKYYHYKAVKPGQYNALRRQSSDSSCWYTSWFCAPLEDSPTIVLTKRAFYEEAQRYPKPMTWVRRPHFKDRFPFSAKFQLRMKGRKHARREIKEELDESYF